MPLYEIINPSDAYTIDCPDLELAFVAAAVLGAGQYALDPIGHDGEKVPLFIFGGHDAWCAEKLAAASEVVIERVLDGRKVELAACLDTVLLGGGEDARVAFAASGRDREAWHDERRTSMNDIGRRAWRVAARLRGETA